MNIPGWTRFVAFAAMAVAASFANARHCSVARSTSATTQRSLTDHGYAARAGGEYG